MLWLVYGSTGWIGKQFINSINNNITIVKGLSRFENFNDIKYEIKKVNPDRVVVFGGLTYKSPATNIDWCEDNKQEVIRVNVLGILNIADICEQMNIHCTILGTGCIYTYSCLNGCITSEDYFEEFDEDCMWNFDKSFYSKTKAYVQELLKCYNKVLLLRIRMPINNGNDPKNFITKLKKFNKIISIPNSMTVLPELIPVMIKLIQEGETGTWNIVNPGVISHKEIMEMCGIDKEYVDITKQSELTRVARSNNHLSTGKLMQFAKKHNLIINDIHIAVKNMID